MAAIDEVKLNFQTNLNFSLRRNVPGLTPTISQQSFKKVMAFITGAALEFGLDEVYAAVRTLAGGANEVLDLSGAGGLTNPLGDANIVFARLKILFVWLLSPSDRFDDGTDTGVVGTLASSIQVGGAASAPAGLWFGDVTDTVRVYNGGQHLNINPSAAGVALTPTTADKLKILNNDALVSAKYLLVLAGGAT